MFTNIVFNYPNWLQQKDHETSIDTRPVIVRFSFGSRSLLVRSSFVSRSSLVAYSLVYRRPNEDQAKTERETDERRTTLGRETIEDTTRNCQKPVWMADFSFSSFSLSYGEKIFAMFLPEERLSLTCNWSYNR